VVHRRKKQSPQSEVFEIQKLEKKRFFLDYLFDSADSQDILWGSGFSSQWSESDDFVSIQRLVGIWEPSGSVGYDP